MSESALRTKPPVSLDDLCNWTVKDGCVIDVERTITYMNVQPTDALFAQVRDDIAGETFSVWWTLAAMMAGLLLGLIWQAWQAGRSMAEDMDV